MDLGVPAQITGRVSTITPKRGRSKTKKDKGKRIPCARSGHCAVSDDHNLYVFGGYNPNTSELKEYYGRADESCLFRELWKYNFATNTWTLHVADNTPTQLASMSILRCGHFIVMYGGTGYPFGYTSTNRVRIFNTKTEQWQTLKSGAEQRPIRSYGQSIAVLNNHLYVFGGTTGWEYSSDVHRINLQTGEWEKLFNYEQHVAEIYNSMRHYDRNNETCPQSRYRHEMLCDGERLYILGGGNSGTTFALDTIYAFNLSTLKWEKLKSKPDPKYGHPGRRRCHGCAQLGNEGFISGGFNGGLTIYDDIWILSIPTLQWTKLSATLPEPVYFHASAITPSGCLYYHGGVTCPRGEKRTNKLNCVRVKAPSLLQAAWQIVCASIPGIENMPRQTLLRLGVPQTLLDGLQTPQ